MFRKSVILALLAMFAATHAGAQQSGAKWLAFQGCWRPLAGIQQTTDPTAQIVCVVPGENANTAILATIDSGRVVQRTNLAANGELVPRSEAGCVGTERAAWSSTGTRVYMRVEQTCEGGNKRSASGVITVLADNEWADVQAVTVAMQKSVRVVRYTEVVDLSGVPAEITTALRASAMAARAARIAASVPVSAAEIVDASKSLDAATVQAWLVEARPELKIDGKELTRLAKAGVAPEVTDLLVALAYPEVFTVNHSGEPQATPQNVTTAGAYGGGGAYGGNMVFGDYYDPFYYDPFYRYDPYYRYGRYGSYYSPYGYYGSYRNRYYSNYTPVIIIVKDGSTVGQTPVEPRGKVVAGQGYTRGGSTGASGNRVSSGSSRTSGSSGGSAGSSSSGSSGSSSAGSSSSGSSSSGTARTAKPKTIPPPM